MGIAKTTYDGVVGLADVATNFIPGGKAFQNISGLANFASRGRYGTSLVKQAGKKGGGIGGAKGEEGGITN